MHSSRFLVLVITLLVCLHCVVAIPPHLVDRQDDGVSSRRSQAPSTNADSNTSAAVKQSTAANTQSDRSFTPTASSSTQATASTVARVPSTTVTEAPAASNSADADSENALPIKPIITPAMGIMGVVLLLTGMAYTVIGIKNRWLYVFFSAGYLSALAVTVLIIYLMADSVSNAIQGAFLVAACLTGMLFGAMALVFSDITEGLGCLLGGFCLSMWFLTLKEGGLIPSSTGRTIFISVMTIAGYCLSFSHHTRTYGLIGCMSFSGATAMVLGIDCFSRAGLKEFWLYIWNLHPGMFPLFTTTYPTTKGMRAEQASIVLFCIFGVISQLKLWKMVKERREKKATSRLEREEQSARDEEALGLKIEDKFAKERAQWEAIYGDKAKESGSAVDRTNSDTSPSSSSVKEKASSVYGTEAHAVGKQGPQSPTMGASDEIQPIDAQGHPVPANKRLSVLHSDGLTENRASVRASSQAIPRPGGRRSISSTNSLQSSAPPPPPVIPLPFSVPTGDDAQSEGDNDSVSAVPESVHASLPDARRFSKRFSGSGPPALSSTRPGLPWGDSEEELVPHIQDDRSSVAATLDGSDDGMSLPELPPPKSPRDSTGEQPPADGAGGDAGEDAGEDAKCTSADVANGEEGEGLFPSRKDSGVPMLMATGVSQSLTSSTDPKPEATKSEVSGSNEGGAHSNADGSAQKEGEGSHQQSSSTKSGEAKVESHSGPVEGALPEKLSKVALSYRTNEWAKHLEAAEKPEVEELEAPGSPGVQLDDSPAEQPVRVSEEILGPLMPKKSAKRVSIDTNAHQIVDMDRPASGFSGSVYMERAASRSSLGLRTPLGPLGQRPMGPTLMNQRESMVRNRLSSQSFTPMTSVSNLSIAMDDQENMTLSQRRRQLQHHKPPPSASQKWQKETRAVQRQSQEFDSHQPRRASGSGNDEAKREALLAGWRESIRQSAGTAAPGQAAVEESRRASMMNERRQKEAEKQQRELARQQRESIMGSRMRSQDMLEAHRDAMRRLQASANKNV